MNIVVLDGHVANPGDLDWTTFSDFGKIVVHDRTQPELIIGRIGDAEVILTNKTPITRETMLACKSLRYIGVLATGVNIVDLSAAKELGIIVTNVPGYGTDAVAQHAIALMLECANHVSVYHRAVSEGQWIVSEDWSMPLRSMVELSGKTLGIVGGGNIGNKVMTIAKAFGMNTIVCGRNLYNEDASGGRVSLNQLLAESDFISLHCPLTEDTKELINRETIAKMKPGAVIVNTARGALINEQDVADALENRVLSAYAADVLISEPMDANCPLYKAKNAIITPHVAWSPIEARTRLLEIAYQNIQAFLENKATNVVS